MMKKNKLGVIVPYRDRYDQLLDFKIAIQKHLKSQNIDFELIVVEQDGARAFNRGKLLNIGFLIAKKLKCNYVVFHDVDMLPVDADYSYSEIPIHLATSFVSDAKVQRIVFDEYFGGVTIFPMDVFENINGYSNEYWGWGYEDNDLLYRCKSNRVELDKKEIKMMGGNTAALKFNGNDSYVKFKNIVDLLNPITFFVSFCPDDITCNHLKYDDTYAVYTIPGFDLLISYNSYKRYNFEIYDSNKNVIYINSDIKIDYKTAICVTINPRTKVVTMYQDGIMVGSKTYHNVLYNYTAQKSMYLGVGDPDNKREPKYFKGLITSFALYSKILDEEEIYEISNNQFFGLTQSFGKYKSEDFLKLYYDAKFIKDYKLVDLTGNNNNGEIVNCEIVEYVYDKIKILEIPYRRQSIFSLLSHEENGYVGHGWKNIEIRYNQLIFHNHANKGLTNTKEDGLSNCIYKELSRVKLNNETHIIVEI